MNIAIDEFYERTGLDVRDGIQRNHLDRVVSMKEIVTPLKIEVMPTYYIQMLLSHVVLEGDNEKRVYFGCEIRRVRIDPGQLMVGQTFVQRSKYQAILENVPKTFAGFQMNHGAKCTALIVFGVTKDRDFAVAHYIPPLIEHHKNHLILLDGVHRNFLVKGVGTTIESILINNVETPFPCDLLHWECIKVVDEKPPRHERFQNLKPELFRDLKYVGIDG